MDSRQDWATPMIRRNVQELEWCNQGPESGIREKFDDPVKDFRLDPRNFQIEDRDLGGSSY